MAEPRDMQNQRGTGRNTTGINATNESDSSHPVATGVGALGGAAAGVAAGAVAGPVGSVVGAVAGAVVGGLGGNAVGRAFDPAEEDRYWRENYTSEPYYEAGRSYDDYGPAYTLGMSGRTTYGGSFDEAETNLSTEWERQRGGSSLSWDQAREPSRAAWRRLDERMPLTGDSQLMASGNTMTGSGSVSGSDHGSSASADLGTGMDTSRTQTGMGSSTGSRLGDSDTSAGGGTGTGTGGSAYQSGLGAGGISGSSAGAGTGTSWESSSGVGSSTAGTGSTYSTGGTTTSSQDDYSRGNTIRSSGMSGVGGSVGSSRTSASDSEGWRDSSTSGGVDSTSGRRVDISSGEDMSLSSMPSSDSSMRGSEAFEHGRDRSSEKGGGAFRAVGSAQSASAGDISDKDDVIDVLNDLVECCRDGEYGFNLCAEHVQNPELKRRLTQHAEECRTAARDLMDRIRQLGGEPDDGGSLMGSMHRGWVSMKGTLAGYSDRAMLEEAERGEDAALARYHKALDEKLPADIKSLVQRQADGVKRNHDEMKVWRDRLKDRT